MTNAHRHQRSCATVGHQRGHQRGHGRDTAGTQRGIPPGPQGRGRDTTGTRWTKPGHPPGQDRVKKQAPEAQNLHLSQAPVPSDDERSFALIGRTTRAPGAPSQLGGFGKDSLPEPPILERCLSNAVHTNSRSCPICASRRPAHDPRSARGASRQARSDAAHPAPVAAPPLTARKIRQMPLAPVRSGRPAPAGGHAPSVSIIEPGACRGRGVAEGHRRLARHHRCV